MCIRDRLDAITDEDARQKALLEAQYEQWRNKAISDPYEPGSVFKIITASSVLEEKVISLNHSFTCTGTYESGGVTYHCWKLAGHGTQNFAQTLQNSCNPAFISYGQALRCV